MQATKRDIPGGGPGPSEDALIPPEDVAPIIGKSARWLKEQARAGRIPHRRVGRSYMFASEDIEAMKAQFQRPVAGRGTA
ncbi:helix-turn-helix domain-containing protein [Actinomadura nitritigenes]|uniref:helix-turn-helix domain-containing protein n=1 Tax=Actinomadura nitritigenes TaxID=134602 RepID=UPI003D8B9CEF